MPYINKISMHENFLAMKSTRREQSFLLLASVSPEQPQRNPRACRSSDQKVVDVDKKMHAGNRELDGTMWTERRRRPQIGWDDIDKKTLTTANWMDRCPGEVGAEEGQKTILTPTRQAKLHRAEMELENEKTPQYPPST